MKFTIKILLLIMFISASVSARTTFNFNSDWKVFVGDAVGAEKPDFDDSGCGIVTTPYTWNDDDAFRKDIAKKIFWEFWKQNFIASRNK